MGRSLTSPKKAAWAGAVGRRAPLGWTWIMTVSLIRGTLEGLEEKLDSSQFVRLNRSCLVRLDFIRELQNWFHGEYRVVLQSGVTQTWTRRYLNRHPELLQKL